jgi:hypothetical protein
MPIFDVIQVNHKQLALVTIAKQQKQIENVDDEHILKGYVKWRTYLRKQLKERKSLTSIVVEHVFE